VSPEKEPSPIHPFAQSRRVPLTGYGILHFSQHQLACLVAQDKTRRTAQVWCRPLYQVRVVIIAFLPAIRKLLVIVARLASKPAHLFCSSLHISPRVDHKRTTSRSALSTDRPVLTSLPVQELGQLLHSYSHLPLGCPVRDHLRNRRTRWIPPKKSWHLPVPYKTSRPTSTGRWLTSHLPFKIRANTYQTLSASLQLSFTAASLF
jgi:hypothetical protein